MRQFLLILILITLSYILKRLVRGRLRDILTPFSVIWVLIWYPLQPYVLVGSSIVILVCWAYYFFSLGLLTNGYDLSSAKGNDVLRLLLIFWVYLEICMLWGDIAIKAFIYHILLLMEFIAAGYFTALWIIARPERFDRILQIVPFAGFVILALYQKNGAFSSGIDAEMRVGIDTGELNTDRIVNVNWVGLSMAGLFPWFVLALMQKYKSRAWTFLKYLNVIPLLATAYIIVRTGSRNASMIFLPVLYYIAFLEKRVKVYWRWIMLLGIVAGGVYYLSAHTYAISELRMFSYSGNLAEMSNGRLDEMKVLYNRIPDIKKMIGAGAPVFHYAIGDDMRNCLSIYFQIFYEVGPICFTFFMFILSKIWIEGRKNGYFGHLAIFFLLCWMFTGIGEACNFMRTGIGCKFMFGMAIAFCNPRIVRQYGQGSYPMRRGRL